MASMKKDEFNKSLNRLESLAKSQLFHTGSDSAPGNWAGSSPEDEDSMNPDSIDDNGTDYNGVKKSLAAKVAKSQALTPAEVAIVKGQDPRKLIADKISKGESLTPAESWVTKGGYAKMAKSEEHFKASGGKSQFSDEQKPGNAASNEMHAANDQGDSANEEEANKSFDGAVEKSQVLQKGLEMSPLLVEFARAIGVGLQGVEDRTATRVAKSLVQALGPVLARVDSIEKGLASLYNEQGEFNKSFAEALVGIGHQVASTAELSVAAAQSPVGPPKSQLRAVQGQSGQVTPIQKSFNVGATDFGSDAIAKSQLANAMVEMVQKGQLGSSAVVKFESTGQIDPATQQAVSAYLQGTGR